jgi:hypothetical protein
MTFGLTPLVLGQCAVYEWHANRAARCLDALLGEGFAGKLQRAGYGAYPAFAKGKSAVSLLGCWAYARRNFFEAQEQAPRRSGRLAWGWPNESAGGANNER